MGSLAFTLESRVSADSIYPTVLICPTLQIKIIVWITSGAAVVHVSARFCWTLFFSCAVAALWDARHSLSFVDIEGMVFAVAWMMC